MREPPPPPVDSVVRLRLLHVHPTNRARRANVGLMEHGTYTTNFSFTPKSQLDTVCQSFLAAPTPSREQLSPEKLFWVRVSQFALLATIPAMTGGNTNTSTSFYVNAC